MAVLRWVVSAMNNVKHLSEKVKVNELYAVHIDSDVKLKCLGSVKI